MAILLFSATVANYIETRQMGEINDAIIILEN